MLESCFPSHLYIYLLKIQKKGSKIAANEMCLTLEGTSVWDLNNCTVWKITIPLDVIEKNLEYILLLCTKATQRAAKSKLKI